MVALSIVLAAACVFMWFAYHGANDRAVRLEGELKNQSERVGELHMGMQQAETVVDTVGKLLSDSEEKTYVLAEELAKVKSQKKSSEVRTGLIAEQMAPFLEGFPYAPGQAIFLGKPLDFLVFDEDGIHFVEVKSGKAQLSSKQRRIRDQLKEKKVTFEVYRIKGE